MSEQQVKHVTVRVVAPTVRTVTQAVQQQPEVPVVPVKIETDEEIIERLRERFEILEDMTRAVKHGDVRAMIVSGAPGVGKSHGVMKVLAKYDTLNALSEVGAKLPYEIVKGTISPIVLYMKLYEFRDSKSIIIFDDCDSIFLDDDTLNMMKAALDSSKKRMISWNKESRVLRDDDIPNTFEFSGGVVFITNLSFRNIRSKKLQEHLAALESRCHYIDLTVETEREKMLRIRQIVSDGMLREYEFEDGIEEEIVKFVDDNKSTLRELSLRTVIKAAELTKSFGRDKWQRIAKISLMK